MVTVMALSLLRSELSRLPNEAWQRARDLKSGDEIAWLSVLTPDREGDIELGLSSDANWVVRTNNGVERISKEKGHPVWLLLLSWQLNDLRDCLDTKSEALGIRSKLSEFLPYNRIILLGLDYGNDPGVLLAIQWLEVDDSLLNDEIRRRLETICRDKMFSQKLRHRASKLAAPLTGRYRH